MTVVNPSATIEEYFEHLDDQLRNPPPEVSSELKGVKSLVMVFVLRGANGGTWTIVVENGRGRAVKRRPGSDDIGNRKIDCRLESSVKTLMNIARGKTKPLTAFMKREIKFSGDRNAFKSIQTALQNAGEHMAPQLEAIKGAVGSDQVLKGGNHPTLDLAQSAAPAVGFGTIFIESSNPRWMRDDESSVCSCCSARFGLLNRRHHCRVCGKLVCGTCSDNTLAGERVCDFCLQEQLSQGAPTPVAASDARSVASSRTQDVRDSFSTPPRSGRRPSAPAALSSAGRPASSAKPVTSATLAPVPETQAPETSFLPFGKLRAKMDREQRVPVSMSVTDPGEHSLLNFARGALSRIRDLEFKVRALTPESVRTRLLRVVLGFGPKVVLGVPLALSWFAILRTALGEGSLPSWGLPVASMVVTATSKWWKLSGWCFLGATVGLAAGSPTVLAAARTVVAALAQGAPLASLRALVGPTHLLKAVGAAAGRLGAAAGVRPLLGLSLLLTGAGVTAVHRTFGRLIHIYGVAACVILVYYSTMVLATRVLHLSDSAQGRLYDGLSRFMAPFVCSQIVVLKSVFVKFGQYLSTRADVLPETWSRALVVLQDEMPADRPEYVEKMLERELGKPFDEVFEEFDFVPMASASVAQVHKAVLRVENDQEPGIPIAVKIQHESIEELLLGDLSAAGTIVEVVAYLNPNFELLKKLHYSWEREMVKELDFRNEADNLRKVRQHLQDAGLVAPDTFDEEELVHDGSDASEGLVGGREEDQVLVPRVLPGYVGKKAFCMTYIESFKITDTEVLDMYGVDRTELMKRVVQAYAYQLYNSGFFNADPHAGNILVAIDKRNNIAKPVLLDFGLTCAISDDHRLGYCKLIHSLAQLSVSGVSDALKAVGYENTQSAKHPERDMEFFGFIMSDTGDRKSRKKQHDAFVKRRKEQKAADLEVDPNVKGRNFSNLPDSLVFLFRVVSLLRGLCASLDVELPYVDLMNNYAQLALCLTHDRKAFAKRLMAPPEAAVPVTAALHTRVSEIVRSRLMEADSDAVGVQVSCLEKGKLVLSVAAGVRGTVDPRPVLHDTLFPLLDLTKVLEALAALAAVDQGDLALSDPVGGQRDVTVEHVLSHASTGMEDAISTTSSHLVLQDQRALAAGFAERAAKPPQPRPKDGLWAGAFHTLSFGPLLLEVLRGRMGESPEEFVRDAVVRKSLSSPECRRQGVVAGEAVYGGFESAEVANVAQASNSFSGMVRDMLTSGGVPSQPAGPTGGEVTLPGRVTMDPCMVNSEAVRRSSVPSLNGFASARALVRILDAGLNQAKLVSAGMVKEAGKPRSAEANALYGGEWKWGLGFQVLQLRRGDADGPLMYMHHSFGGSLCFAVPSKAIAFAILVNGLTLDRELTQRIVTEVCSAFDLGDPAVLFQGGMF